jgi:hypothetical protein
MYTDLQTYGENVFQHKSTTYPDCFSIFSLGSFDHRNRIFEELSSVDTICFFDFIAMFLAVIFIMIWNIKSKDITDSNDANNQTP